MKTFLRILFFFLLVTQICFAQSELSWITNGPFGPNFTDIAIDNEGIIFAQSDSGLYRSTDDGNTWVRVFSPAQQTGGIAIGTQEILVGTDSTIQKSTDKGNTWTTVLTLTRNPLTGSKRTMTSIGISQLTGLILAGGGSSYCFDGKCPCWFEGKMYFSTNDGVSWDTINVNAYVTVTKIFNNGLTFITTTSNGGYNPVLGCNRDSVFRSLDLGNNWIQSLNKGEGISTLEVDGLNQIFLAYRDSIFCSKDSGSTWFPICIFPSRITDLAFNSEDEFFVTTIDSGVFRNYLPVNGGLTNLHTTCLAVSPSGFVFVGTTGGGVFRTTQPTVGINDEIGFSESYILIQNYPNPFNS